MADIEASNKRIGPHEMWKIKRSEAGGTKYRTAKPFM